MSLKGKKIASFLAFPHHTRFFMPIREEIRKHKGDILFVTPLSDYPYELDMIERNLWYRHFTDYLTDDVVNKINTGLSESVRTLVSYLFQVERISALAPV